MRGLSRADQRERAASAFAENFDDGYDPSSGTTRHQAGERDRQEFQRCLRQRPKYPAARLVASIVRSSSPCPSNLMLLAFLP